MAAQRVCLALVITPSAGQEILCARSRAGRILKIFNFGRTKLCFNNAACAIYLLLRSDMNTKKKKIAGGKIYIKNGVVEK
jgi:hypothetical protein